MKVTTALKRSFTAGLILITPLVVTGYVLHVLIGWSLRVVNPIVQGTRLTQYTANVEAVAQMIAAVLIVAGITALGYVAQRNVGRRAFGNVGRVVNVVPLVNTIYTSVRQVANALVDRNTAYDGVVLVEYPREGVYSLGLVTGTSPSSVADHVGEEVYNVFLPNSPNPTAGRLVLLPTDQVHEIDMSVRRGMRLIVTSGSGVDEADVALPDLDAPPE